MSFLGLDVGGTKVSAAVLEDGVLSEPVLHPTRTDSAEALVDQLAEIAQALRTPDTEAVGLGIPSAIDFATGTAKSGVNVPLQGVPLRQLLGERLGLPVFVDNDANVAALAEAHEGGRLVARNLVMFTVGTGVGGGLVLDGRLFRGATGAGAEMGHILIGLDLAKGAPPPADHFPQPGSLEALASGSALDELAQAAAAANPDGALGRIAAGGEEVTGVEVVRLAKEGDAESVDLLRVLGERLGIGIASAINLFDPEEVVVGGGVATAGELLLEPARRAAEGYVLTGVGELAQIRLARHGVRAGVYGATLLAAQEAGRSDQ
ncbi:MAG: glucokinase [Solirubrobacteraceae bacterium]|nr:glucokinase [Solirubrobacteraceae bacterium]